MDGYVPISHRTVEELLARAAEVRRMAETATTSDVSDALLRLPRGTRPLPPTGRPYRVTAPARQLHDESRMTLPPRSSHECRV